jgi:hypothetical protein
MAVFEAFITFILQWRFFTKEGERIWNWSFSFTEAKGLLYHSLPLIIGSFVLMLYQKSGEILVLRFLRDLNLVGQYSAAVRMSEASYFIPVAICAAVFPGIINNRSNPELQLKRYTQLCSIMLWSALLIAIGGTLFGDFVIGNLFKEKYHPALITTPYTQFWNKLVRIENSEGFFDIPLKDRVEIEGESKAFARDLYNRFRSGKECKLTSVYINKFKYPVRPEAQKITNVKILNDFQSIPSGDLQLRANKFIYELAKKAGYLDNLLILFTISAIEGSFFNLLFEAINSNT